MGLALVFLSPWSAVLAAAAVPVLLLLYFLRLRRQMLRIPSTLLWQSSTRDLQANVPLQRLRPSLLLLLQLLALILIVLAIGRPVLRGGGVASSRVILMIDTSASMSAPAGAEGLTRLDAALDAARRAVRRLGRRGEPAQIMIVAFAASARVAGGFESNRGILLDALDAIEPTDEEADLQSALDLAGAFAGADEQGRPPPEIVLFSDGTVAEAGAGGFTLPAGTLRFVGIAEPDEPVDNVGIVTFSARRDYEEPRRVLVFARLLNAGPAAVETPVTLRIDGEPARIRTVRVPAAAPGAPAGEASYTADLEIAGSAALALTTARRDHLAADNAAAIVIAAPATPRIGVVHAGAGPDPFLSGLIEALEPRRLVLLPASDGAGVPWTVDEVDLVVLDGVVPAALPGVPSLGFASTGPRPADPPAPARVLSWDRAHPLLRHVSLDGLVYVRGAGPLQSPWAGIAFGPRGAVIAETTADGTRHVAVAFRLSDSNWPLDVSLTVFVQNVLDKSVRNSGGAALAWRAGEPVTVRARPGAELLRITGPLDAPIELEVTRDGAVTLPRLARVGLYSVRGAVPPNDRIAVNLFSDVESDIRPRREITINARPTAAARAADAAPLELWPWLTAAALAILGLEWLVYCLRVRQ